MGLEAKFYKDGLVLDHAPAADVTAGQVLQVGGMAAIPANSIDADASEIGAVQIEGIFAIRNAAVAGNVGDNVWWDENGTAVDTTTGACTTIGTDGDFWIGTLAKALAATDVVAYVHLNKVNPYLPAWCNRKRLKKVANYTIDSTNIGQVIECDGTALSSDIIVITLPAVASVGDAFEVIVQNCVDDAGSQITIEVDNSDKFVNLNGGAALDDGDTIDNTKATSVRGDYVHLISSAAGWHILDYKGIWADGGAT